MEIKKGNKFLCIKDVEMDDDRTIYYAGETYISEIDGCITDESGDAHHSWIDTKYVKCQD